MRQKTSRSVDTLKGFINGKYELGKIIGQGMIGVVYLARDCSHVQKPTVCIKQMYMQKIKEKKLEFSLKREIRILA